MKDGTRAARNPRGKVIINPKSSLALTGVVPAVCDAEAGEAVRLPSDAPLKEVGLDCCLPDQPPSKPAQMFAKFFKNRAAISLKLVVSTIH